MPGLLDDPESLRSVDESADLILMTREALAAGLNRKMARPERVHQWSYEFDPSGLEILRRAIEHVLAERPAEPVTAGAAGAEGS